ncbi:MAG: DGQHR domain-containing protein, partial [Candidatus Dadabacteria bacterium]|nr:DGQHR domain-containing protein [Candidatus Dadabacteria bacterium]
MTNKLNHRPIVLPALRGVMGDWVFYSTLMNLEQINEQLKYAREIYNRPNLSLKLQRDIDERRGKEIAQYIQTQQQHFFNSLVVAVFGDQLNWHAVENISAREKYLKNLEEEIIESVGFLKLHGDEKLFTIDGQHRLSGIRELFEHEPEEAAALKDEKI